MAKSKGAKGGPPTKQMPLELAPAKARIFTFPSKNSLPSSRAQEADALKRILDHAENLGKKNT